MIFRGLLKIYINIYDLNAANEELIWTILQIKKNRKPKILYLQICLQLEISDALYFLFISFEDLNQEAGLMLYETKVFFTRSHNKFTYKFNSILIYSLIFSSEATL